MYLYVLGGGRPHSGNKHSALRAVGNSISVLDWALDAVENYVEDYYFVSGYASETVCTAYPNLNYLHNGDWKDTCAGWSFLNALPNTPREILVTYSDIVFREAIVNDIINTDGDVVVAIDSRWRSRYGGRDIEDINVCEKVLVRNKEISLSGSNLSVNQANAEFLGLVRFSKKAIEKLKLIKTKSKFQNTNLKQTNLSDIVELLRIDGLSIKAVDVHGAWAELNKPADIAHFILGTKAQTLDRLKKIVKLSQIKSQVSFTTARWSENPSDIINKIQNYFGDRQLIVRSSGVTEDGFLNSNAGAYTSILDILGSNRAYIKNAVDTVIKSYPDKDPNNEVLVQPMLVNIQLSGVVFTRSPKSGAPFYIINYDDESGKSDTITSGTSERGKTFLILRNANEKNKNIPKKLRSLLPALREIERLLNYEFLDIEFAITAETGLNILQVRPISTIESIGDFADESYYNLINELEENFQLHQSEIPFLLGKRTIFGVMPDWNPAEIIGINPSMLATSLYENLITNEVWAEQRAGYGYRDVRPNPLLVSFAGHPYVNVRSSFNSFIPFTLPDVISEKLVEFSIGWLEKNPDLHDKIEFDVIPTCFDLNFARWEDRFKTEAAFSPAEIDQIRKSYLSLTNKALHRISEDFVVIERLECRYRQIKNSSLPPLQKAFVLLDDARRLGALPFAHLARSAFVAINLLRSAVDIGVLSKLEYDDFFHTIHTVSQDLCIDSIACSDGILDWSEFVEKYGHLRPGTYDITSSNYRQEAERYLRPSVNKNSANNKKNQTNSGSLWKDARGRFAKAINKSGLSVTGEEIETFMRTAIEGREYAKFAFSRNLSLALDELLLWGEVYHFDAETISQISLDDLRYIYSGRVFTRDIDQWVRNRAKVNQESARVSELLELPPLITKVDDFSLFSYPLNHPNYIGSGSVISICVELEDQLGAEIDLEGKIILIPSADPGYDWLFNRGIAGLITKFGGANSHMAIRAAEYQLPAAIGIGELQYRNLAGAEELELNPKLRTIRVIR